MIIILIGVQTVHSSKTIRYGSILKLKFFIRCMYMYIFGCFFFFFKWKYNFKYIFFEEIFEYFSEIFCQSVQVCNLRYIVLPNIPWKYSRLWFEVFKINLRMPSLVCIRQAMCRVCTWQVVIENLDVVCKAADWKWLYFRHYVQ